MNAIDVQQTPKPPAPLYSLKQLNELCRKKMRVEMNFCGTELALECYRLLPKQDAILSEIVETVTPPVIKGKTPGEDRPDYTNPDYVKKKMAAERQARAQGLYWCVPAFNAESPGLTDPAQILEFVQGQADEQVLSILWGAIKNGGVKLAELVNFS